jgi:hypothetical protein
MIAITTFSMILEYFIHKFEMKLDEAMWRLMDRVYKELALLGIISFTLFLIQTFVEHLNDQTYEAFEFGHLLIFFLAVAFIIQVRPPPPCDDRYTMEY